LPILPHIRHEVDLRLACVTGVGWSPQPERRSIPYQFSSISLMRAQKQMVVLHQCGNEERDAPRIVLLVVVGQGGRSLVKLAEHKLKCSAIDLS